MEGIWRLYKDDWRLYRNMEVIQKTWRLYMKYGGCIKIMEVVWNKGRYRAARAAKKYLEDVGTGYAPAACANILSEEVAVRKLRKITKWAPVRAITKCKTNAINFADFQVNIEEDDTRIYVDIGNGGHVRWSVS